MITINQYFLMSLSLTIILIINCPIDQLLIMVSPWFTTYHTLLSSLQPVYSLPSSRSLPMSYISNFATHSLALVTTMYQKSLFPLQLARLRWESLQSFIDLAKLVADLLHAESLRFCGDGEILVEPYPLAEEISSKASTTVEGGSTGLIDRKNYHWPFN